MSDLFLRFVLGGTIVMALYEWMQSAVLECNHAANQNSLIWRAFSYLRRAVFSARTEEQKTLLVPSDELVAELQKADEYVIATPMYNFGIPARLKAYVDHVVRSGLTFTMNADGSYTGLLSGKKATVIIASAGEYGPGAPTEGLDTLKPYLREILGFIGVTDVTFIQSGSTWKVDGGSERAEEHIALLIAKVKQAAGAQAA